MYQKTVAIFFALVLWLLSTGTELYGQAFDYNTYPKRDFNITRLQLSLDINAEELLIKGEAKYEMVSNIEGADTLILHAAHMEINDILAGGKEATYHLGNDSLIIELPDPVGVEDTLSVHIVYRTHPQFGVHKNGDGTIWSSTLPRTKRHWYPVVDHPRETFPVEMTLDYPSGRQSVATGVKTGEETLSVDRVRTVWKTRHSIPATGLWFVIGSFVTAQTSFGTKTLTIYRPNDTGTREQAEQLLADGARWLRALEDRLQVAFPYDKLDMIMLPDHRWEEKPYGPGVAFLFENRSKPAHQLLRGISAQWFGVYKREEQWGDAEGINLYQTALVGGIDQGMAVIGEEDTPASVSINPYRTFGVERWNRWQRFYAEWSDSVFKKTVRSTARSILEEDREIFDWNRFADRWYQKTGQPRFQVPVLQLSSDTATTDSIAYRVSYTADETENTMLVEFVAQESAYSELVTLPLVRYSGQGRDTVRVTFTGRRDSVMINFPASVQNIDIITKGRDHLRVDQFKPARFWLYQYRNAGSDSMRLLAARKLGNHSGNPDLQLAIRDMMRGENSPKVRAALLESLAKITSGAAGTEQEFLNHLREGEWPAKAVALRALGNYPGNEQVIAALANYARETDSLARYYQAIDSFLEVGPDSARVLQLAKNVIQSDTTGQRAIYLIQRLPDYGHTDRAIRQAGFYLDPDYAYPVRSRTLEFLASYDKSADRWHDRIPVLLEDNDPRIRYLTVSLMENLDRSELVSAADLIGERMLDEYDGRVFHRMRQLLDKIE